MGLVSISRSQHAGTYQPLPQLKAKAGLLRQQHVHTECWDQCQGHCEAVIQRSSELQTPLPFVTIVQCSFAELSHVPEVNTILPSFSLLGIWLAIKDVIPRRSHITPTPLAPHRVFNLPISSSKSARKCKELF